MASDIITYIDGGSRIQAYSEKLYLKAIARDPDEVNIKLATTGYTFAWRCENLMKKLPCVCEDGTAIDFSGNL